MNLSKQKVKIFKIKNRNGYAATCANHLTEGVTSQQAFDRMVKAIHRTAQKAKRKR